jgi:hypothetical protein
MIFSFRKTVAGFALLTVIAAGAVHAQESGVTPQARWIAHQLDSMGVETKWIAGAHVDWETGLPDGVAEKLPGRHTHCSGFVAAAAEKLGVYILRPPEHGQELLANAQNEWLAIEGRAEGWRPLDGPVDAQNAANRGLLVVASYHNHNSDKPGHIAIVRPGDKSVEKLLAEGPDVIEASTINESSISVKAGFAGHVYAWGNDEIDYYAHAVKIRE